MKFFNILLKEGRKEDLKKKYTDKFKEWPNTLDFILGISDLIDFNHKYTDFVLKNLRPNSSTDDIEDVVELVKDFDKYSSQFPKKDINQYNSLSELRSLVEFVRNKKRDKELENQTEKIYEDDDFLVIVPKTQGASCKYGSGTKWCVTQRGSGHFDRYTSGRKDLYFIIRKKGTQKEKHYKVAIHFDENGNQTWWDAQDNAMNVGQVELFKEYFPDLYDAVVISNAKKRQPNTKMLDEVFSVYDTEFYVDENFENSGKILRLQCDGFEIIPDMDERAIGRLTISLDDDEIDKYDIFVSYGIKDFNNWYTSVGFSDDEENIKFDLELYKWGYEFTSRILFNEPEVMRNIFIKNLFSTVERKLRQNTEFIKFVRNISGPVWTPRRLSYGYTFGKNKGLIKKLVDWLDEH
jgi:hypothetical protein